MRILLGRVKSVDPKNNSGLIIDKNGREFIFTQFECRDEVLPLQGEKVSFIHDPDFKTINVAVWIHPVAN